MKKFVSAFLTAMMTLMLAGCGSGNVIRPDSNNYAEGGMGDTMRTYFFDYTVNSAYLCDTYADYTAVEGYDILVAELTIKNTDTRDVEMYDSDFQVQWGSNDSEAFDFSLTYYDESLDSKAFPGAYTLAPKESRTGYLVFEVPEGENNFSISYLELFDDNSSGATFFVFFTAEKK